MPQSFVRLFVHVIFSTKNRQPTIPDEVRPRLFGYLGGIIRECHGEPIVVNGMAEHVHILMAMPSEKSISEMIRLIKSNSSKWGHEQIPSMKRFAWQNGYAAFSVSASNVEQVRSYITNQEKHHRNRTFAEEYEAILSKHGFVQHPNDLAA